MASSLCIALLLGSTLHVFPTDGITLKWTHTVEKSPWEEDYRVVDGALIIEEARIRTGGAGMEPPRDAIWSSGWWRYKPAIGPLEDVILANSEFGEGYTICRGNACQLLRELTPAGELVKITRAPCAGGLIHDHVRRNPEVQR